MTWQSLSVFALESTAVLFEKRILFSKIQINLKQIKGVFLWEQRTKTMIRSQATSYNFVKYNEMKLKIWLEFDLKRTISQTPKNRSKLSFKPSSFRFGTWTIHNERYCHSQLNATRVAAWDNVHCRRQKAKCQFEHLETPLSNSLTLSVLLSLPTLDNSHIQVLGVCICVHWEKYRIVVCERGEFSLILSFFFALALVIVVALAFVWPKRTVVRSL